MKLLALLLALATAQVPYAQIKAAIVSLRAHQPHRGVAPGEKTYDVESCELGSDFIGDGNRLEAITRAGIYADVANYVSIWESDLPRVGYPSRVWHAWVAHYEAAAIATADAVRPADFYEIWTARAPRLSGLLRVLETYRASHPRAAAVRDEGGCGAGEVPVKVVTQPVAAQVSIIPAFFYELCRVQRVNPDDTSRCAHWHDVTGSVTQVAGDYHYVARWRDGTVRRGMLNLDSALVTGTVTLRKP